MPSANNIPLEALEGIIAKVIEVAPFLLPPSVTSVLINRLPNEIRQEHTSLLLKEAAFWNNHVLDFAANSPQPEGRFLSAEKIGWEVDSLTHIFRKLSFSQDYHDIQQQSLAVFIDTLMDSPWFVSIAQTWSTLSQDTAMEFLQKISALRRDIYTQSLNKKKNTITGFMPEPASISNAARDIFAHHGFSSENDTHITEFSRHRDQEFSHFLRVMQTLHHEETHGDQYALAFAFEQGTLSPDHPLYVDALLLHSLCFGEVPYINIIQKIYANNPIEIDAAQQDNAFSVGLFHSFAKIGIELQPSLS